MEDAIDASPTSQKKRKKVSKCRVPRKILTTDRDVNLNNQNVITKDPHNSSFGRTIDNSDCLTRNDIWQYANLLEKADKARTTSEKSRVYNRCNRNDFNMSGVAGFLTATQLCAAQPSTSSNFNETKDSQWDVTESQLRKLEDAVEELHGSKVKCHDPSDSNTVQTEQEFAEVSNDLAVVIKTIADVDNNEQLIESANVGDDSFKRRSSVLQSILSEWETSPVKKNKLESEKSLLLSPKFIFNRRRTKRTYLRKQRKCEKKKLLPEFKRLSPATLSRCSEVAVHLDDEIKNIRPEFSQQLIVPTNGELHDEEVDLSTSLNIVDNFQNLCEFYTQSAKTESHGCKIVDAKNIGSSKPSLSLDEEDFFGFDGCGCDFDCGKSIAVASITWPERFYEFVSNSDNSCASSISDATDREKDLLMGDDEIFANFQTQQYSYDCHTDCFVNLVPSTSAAATSEDDLLNRTLSDGSHRFELNPRAIDAVVPTTTSFRVPNLLEDGHTSNPFLSGIAVGKTTNKFIKFKVNEHEHANNIFGDIDRDFDFESVLQTRRTDFNSESAFAGFSTAGGKEISVSSTLISRKTNIFRNVNVTGDEMAKMTNWIDDMSPIDKPNVGETNFDLNTKPAFPGFTTAGGSHITVSSALIAKKTNIFDNVTVSADELKTMNWMDDMDRIDEPSVNDSSFIKRPHSDLNPDLTFVGFTTARGSRIPVSSTQLSKKNNIFKNVEVTDEELGKMDYWIDDVQQNGSCSNQGGKADVARTLRPLFSDPVNKVEQTKQSNSTGLFREVTNIAAQREADTQSKKLPVSTFIRPSPMRKMSMVNSLRKLETLKENVGGKLNSFIENEGANPTSDSPINATTSMMHTPASSSAYVCVTPTNNPKTYTQECRESAAAILQDDELTLVNRDQSKDQTPGYVAGFMAELTVSSTPIHKVDNYRHRPKQRRLVEKFDDIAGENYFESSIPSETVKIQVPPAIKSLRKRAFAEQQRSVTTKTNVKPVPSFLFVRKLTSTKVNWREFVEHSHPVNRPTTEAKLATNVRDVTAENATKFKFNAWDHYSEEFCRENINGIFLQDDIQVMMDEYCQIGIKEISTAFLSCPSVDPKLVHHKWIENHLKWIVVKLAAMERSFPGRFIGQMLTLENVMLQMKYRYEREIDRAERSAIRKICEMDDTPAKRMILFVARITQNGFNCEIELSDGWYSLMSTLDNAMAKLVTDGKIKLGTKLVIQGANTTDLNDGCHPLDVPSNVKLKIHANSTRRARWDAKLGYCKNPEQFKISLRSVVGSGGNITKLRIVVLRVYPVVYIDPKNLSVVHSERVERRRSINDEREKLSLIEKIFSQVRLEFEEEEIAARYENNPKKIVKLAEIPSITDAAYLCDLLDEDNDPGRIESELTNTQKRMILDYRDKMNCLRNEEIRTRVNEKLASVDKDTRKLVPLLRFRVTDETSFDKTALVTVWKPTEEIISKIKEETVYNLTGSGSRGLSFNELQIYAGKDAIFEKLSGISQVPMSLRRRHTSIAEIVSIDEFALNELDTTGLVVHVGETLQKFQSVYISDGDQNIVCINFWKSLKNFAYEDVVQAKRFLSIKNLQWRKSSNSKPIPSAYVTEYSIFTENPQSSELSSAITSLKSRFATVDLDAFIETCMEKIKSHNTNASFLSTSAGTHSMSPLQSSASSLPKTPNHIYLRPGRSSLSNQSRIELLSKCGDAIQPATPPLHINSLSKCFTPPVSKT